MTNNKLMVNKNIIHKIIIVDFIINVLLLLVAIINAYQVMFRISNPSGYMLPASLILLFITFILSAYDIVYLFESVKGDKTFGMSRIMAIASVCIKIFVLICSLLIVCFVGPSKFISMFDIFFS